MPARCSFALILWRTKPRCRVTETTPSPGAGASLINKEASTLMELHYFEDFPPGYRYQTPARTVFEADIVNFVAISGLYEDLFCNIEWINNESPIKGGRYAPIALLWAFAQGLTTRTGLYEKTFVAILGVDAMRITQPCLVGDTMHVEVTVKEARVTSRGDRGVLNSRFELVNQRGETFMHYDMQQMVLCRP